MSNEEQEQVIAPEETQEVTTDSTVETTTEEENTVDWRAEALKYKAMLTRKNKKPSQPLQEITAPESIVRDVQELKLERSKREFGFANNLSPEETDIVYRFDGKNPGEALKNPFIKTGLEAFRNQKKAEASSLSPSSRAPKLAQDDFNKMTSEERQKSFEARMKALR